MTESVRRRAPSVTFEAPRGGALRRVVDRALGRQADALVYRVSGAKEGGVSFSCARGEGAAWTDRGRGMKYATNQDGFLVGDAERTWLVVCDGVGGHGAGDLASHCVLAYLEACFADDTPLVEAIGGASEALATFNRGLPEDARNDDMSTTVLAAELRGHALQLAHAGDSRAMLVRDGAVIHETTEHTLAHQLAETGRISFAEIAFHPERNVLVRSVMLEEGGNPRPMNPEVTEHQLRSGDLLLLCSDGYEPFIQSEILDHVRKGKRPQRIVASMRRQLHQWVSSERTDDNATLIAFRVA